MYCSCSVKIILAWLLCISGPVDSDNTYDTTIPEHGGEPSRSFTGALHNVSWTFDHIQCIYAGNSQGGPEIRDMMDSVIAGVYWDYAVDDLFSEDGYKFRLFRSDLASSYNTGYNDDLCSVLQ